MRVLVTGGSGKIGRYVVGELVGHGHEVINADRRRPSGDLHAGERFVETDAQDIGQVAGVMRECEAVVHLGAIPAPYSHADEVVFRNNTVGTFAVFQAAALLGVQRVAFASSVSGYGMAWSKVPFSPFYAPMDEDHPFVPREAYGLSKEVDECTARMFHRQTGMTVGGMRFHWVANPEELAAIGPEGQSDLEQGARIFWGYVDVRDAAAACRLAIEKTGYGCEMFNIVAPDTLLSQDTEPLIRKYHPETEIRGSLKGNQGGYVIEKAERILGWRPVHTRGA
jgi:nucleoside-diphosphate-sugar epimerase